MGISAKQSVPTWLLGALVAIALVLGGGVAALAVAGHQRDEALVAERLAAHKAREADQQAAVDAASLAAEEKAAEEKAAEEKAAEEKAAEEAAAQEARERAAAKRAEARRIKREAAQEAADDQRARERAAAALSQVITGDFTVPDINGALITQVGGYPGQPLTTLDMARLNRMGTLIKSLRQGKTYPCPQGAGGGFSDIVAGTQVIVQDGSGAVLATTALTGGRVNMRGCTFDFRIEVPAADFYQVLVSHRGALTYSRDDLARSGWHVSGRL